MERMKYDVWLREVKALLADQPHLEPLLRTNPEVIASYYDAKLTPANACIALELLAANLPAAAFNRPAITFPHSLVRGVRESRNLFVMVAIIDFLVLTMAVFNQWFGSHKPVDKLVWAGLLCIAWSAFGAWLLTRQAADVLAIRTARFKLFRRIGPSVEDEVAWYAVKGSASRYRNVTTGIIALSQFWIILPGYLSWPSGSNRSISLPWDVMVWCWSIVICITIALVALYQMSQVARFRNFSAS